MLYNLVTMPGSIGTYPILLLALTQLDVTDYIGCMKTGQIMKSPEWRWYEPQHAVLGGGHYFTHAWGSIYVLSGKAACSVAQMPEGSLRFFANEGEFEHGALMASHIYLCSCLLRDLPCFRKRASLSCLQSLCIPLGRAHHQLATIEFKKLPCLLQIMHLMPVVGAVRTMLYALLMPRVMCKTLMG